MAIVTSVLTGGSNNHETTSEEANGIYTDFVSEGIVGTLSNTSGAAPATGGFAVNATGTPDTNVQISAGVAYVTGTPSSQNSQTFRVKNSATATLAISANSSGSTKYDWIYIKLDATNLNTPNSAGDNVATIVASRSTSISTDDGTPPTYGYPIAIITLANGWTTVTNSMISDVRTQASVSAAASGASADWNALGATPSTVVYNGNRNYTLTFTSTDYTDRLSPGKRLKFTRTTTAPTQCADLEASSSQYFVDTTTNANMTFTDDFACAAWIKLESYTNGTIASRYNGTSGWRFDIDGTGNVRLIGHNAGSGNVTYITSIQSVPLGRWVHVAAQLDMSSSTVTGGTANYIMINGVDVPCQRLQSGTNPTALIQAGNLEVGACNGGTVPFDGKLAQVAVFSAKVTQADMRTYISQGLLGTESNLLTAFSLNNSLVDLNTSTANTLVGQNSAVATNADTPFAGGATGTTEYGIVSSASYSSSTTVNVQVPSNYAIPTVSSGISAVSYASDYAPYGFPTAVGDWQIETLIQSNLIQASATQNQWYFGTSSRLTVPIGKWDVSYNIGSAYCAITGTGTTSVQPMMGTTDRTGTTTAPSDAEFHLTAHAEVNASSTSAATAMASSLYRSQAIVNTSETPYYLHLRTIHSGGTNLQLVGGARGTTIMTARYGYI